jgi:hypothetical protein
VRLLCRRAPHPDPLTEARLQRIISLWEALRRQVDLSRQHAEEIGKLGGEYRELVRTGLTGLAIDMERRIKSSSARPPTIGRDPRRPRDQTVHGIISDIIDWDRASEACTGGEGHPGRTGIRSCRRACQGSELTFYSLR